MVSFLVSVIMTRRPVFSMEGQAILASCLALGLP